MCPGVPGNDEVKRLCLAYLPDLQIGEYTIAHAGFPLTRIDEASATVTIVTMTEYGVFGEERVVPS